MTAVTVPLAVPLAVLLATPVAASVAPTPALAPADAAAGTAVDLPGGALVVRPVAGAVVQGFAPPTEPYGSGHRGVDLAAAPGEEVRAVMAGLVTFAGTVAGRGWVTVDHGGGLETTYGVLATRRVDAGRRVAAGEVLGVLGEAADHVDWGARLYGGYVDPLALLGRWEAHLVRSDRLVEPVLVPAVPPGLPPVGSGAWTWPTVGTAGSGFGTRWHPIRHEWRPHTGTDIPAPTGTPIVAAAAGVVTFSGVRGGYGNTVIVDHGGGVETRYAHASVLLVAAGARVERGQLIARVGSTGNSTGPHLHFEYRVGGQPRDPMSLYGR